MNPWYFVFHGVFAVIALLVFFHVNKKLFLGNEWGDPVFILCVIGGIVAPGVLLGLTLGVYCAERR